MASKFLEDNQGNNSMMRLMCASSLVFSFIFGLITILRPETQDGVLITFGFLVGAFAPKTLQKYVEMNVGIKK